MTWPAGQRNGNFAYEELTEAQLAIAAGASWAAGSRNILFPWGAGGYNKCRIDWFFSVNVNGNVSLQMSPQSSAGLFGVGPLGGHELILPALAVTAGTSWQLQLAFDDGVLPGSWTLKDTTTQNITTGGMVLNPTWQMNADLLVLFFTVSAGVTVTSNNINVALKG